MLQKIEDMIRKAKGISEVILSYHDQIRMVSHHDADGIASAAIIVKALLRERKNIHLSFVKQLTEDFIRELASEKNGMVIFLDLGSGYLENIQRYLLKDKTKVIICDHHQIEGAVLPQNAQNLFHINPINFGIEENVSGSGISYLLARTIGPQNIDLSELGIIGAIGDSQVGSIGADWGLFGLNKEILKDSVRSGKIKIEKGLRLWGRYTRPLHKALQYSYDPYIPGVSGSESGSVQFLQDLGIELKRDNGWRTLSDLSDEEQKKLATGIIKERIKENHENPEWIFGDVYELLEKKDDFRDANEFATLLNACGKQGRCFLGVALCLNDPESFSEVREVLEAYRREIGKAISWAYENKDSMKETENAFYILAGDKIPEQVASNVVSIISRSEFHPNIELKPIFMLVDTEEGQTKVSARASDKLVENGLDLKDVMVKATKAVGGEGGGHKGASGALIPRGSESSLIKNIEDILSTKDINTQHKKTLGV